MAEPTFNGSPIFGPVTEMGHESPSNAVQINHYPGTKGMERLDLGKSEEYTTVKGLLCGASPEELGAACQAVRTLKNNGVLGTLMDTDGISWDDAIIESFRTFGRATYATDWGWCREYEMRIVHTGIPSDGTGEPT